MGQWTRCDLSLINRMVGELRDAEVPVPVSVAELDLRYHQRRALREVNPVRFPSAAALAKRWGWETAQGRPARHRVRVLLKTDWGDPYGPIQDAWSEYVSKRYAVKTPIPRQLADSYAPVLRQLDPPTIEDIANRAPVSHQFHASSAPVLHHTRVGDSYDDATPQEQPPQFLSEKLAPPEGEPVMQDSCSEIPRILPPEASLGECSPWARDVAEVEMRDGNGLLPESVSDWNSESREWLRAKAVAYHNRSLNVIDNGSLVQATAAVLRDEHGQFLDDVVSDLAPTPHAVEFVRNELVENGWMGSRRRRDIARALATVLEFARGGSYGLG
jgi:hypothetical protein